MAFCYHFGAHQPCSLALYGRPVHSSTFLLCCYTVERESYGIGRTRDWRLRKVGYDVCEWSKRAHTLLWPYRLNHMLMPLVHHHPTVLPRKGRQAEPRQLMMTIYTWNEDVWLPFKLRCFSGKLHLPVRSVTTSGAVGLSQCSNAVNMKLLQIRFVAVFVLQNAFASSNFDIFRDIHWETETSINL